MLLVSEVGGKEKKRVGLKGIYGAPRGVSHWGMNQIFFS